mmetsp:Transcript_11522/g.16687  ORF Transcript_11522/g.16687 Transcript_11522/m.16687 type:complete len:921 (-) Transcript_11522:159-2921(-)
MPSTSYQFSMPTTSDNRSDTTFSDDFLSSADLERDRAILNSPPISSYFHAHAESSVDVDFDVANENAAVESGNDAMISTDSERQILLLMLLAQVCSLHDATPRTFTVHVLSLFERGILDKESIQFLFDLGLVPNEAVNDAEIASDPSASFSSDSSCSDVGSLERNENQRAIVSYRQEREIVPYNPISVEDFIKEQLPSTTEESVSNDMKEHNRKKRCQIFSRTTMAVEVASSVNDTNRSESSKSESGTKNRENSSAKSEQEMRRDLIIRSKLKQQNDRRARAARKASVLSIRERLERHDSIENENIEKTSQSKFGRQAKTDQNKKPNMTTFPIPESSITKNQKPATPSSSWAVEHHPLSLSRYQREFNEVRLLASGSFGEVYHATNKSDNRDYAVKRVTFAATGFANDSVQLVMREVRCLAQCDHPNVVRYYTSWLEPSWMTGSAEPVTADQIASKATQRRLLTDIHRMVLSHEEDSEGLRNFTSSAGHLDRDSLLSRAGTGRNKSASVTQWEQLESHRSYVSTSNNSAESDDSDCSEWSNEDTNDRFNAKGTSSHRRVRGPRLESRSSDSSCGFDFVYSTAGSSVNSSQQHRLNEEQPWDASSQNRPPITVAQQNLNYKYRICLFIQMQLCQQSTLADWIRIRNLNQVGITQGSRQWARTALDISLQIVRGIAHVHGKGIIHRDLKPANIFAADDGVFKIGDFGLSKLLVGSTANIHSPMGARTMPVTPKPSALQDRGFSSITQTFVSYREELHTGGVGTQSYAAPEQLNSENYGSEADIFSIGLLLLELFCGFQTEHERAQGFHDCRSRGELPDKMLPYPEISALILSCTQADPTKRPSASDILATEISQETDAEIYRAQLQNVQVELEQKNQEIKRHLAKLEEKDKIIAELYRKTNSLSISSGTCSTDSTALNDKKA